MRAAVDRSRLPVPGPEPAFRFPVVRRHALGNEMRVWTVEHPQVPVLSFLLLLTSGAAGDPPARPGLAALTADMVDEGSGTLSALDIEDALSRLGAQFDTEVGSDAAILSLVTLSRFRDQALALLADIAVRPRIDPADFARVRDLRATRLRQLRDLPPAVADRAFAGLLYPDHPYGHLPIGTAASLAAATRDEVVEFHARTWRPSLATLIAVGDGTHEELLEAADRVFGSWRNEIAPGVAGGKGDVTIPPAPRSAAKLAIVDRPGAAQSEIRLGQVAVPRLTPDYHALLMLNATLGGQFVSRLNMNLREDKGYTYGVRSGFEFRRAAGPFLVQAAVQTNVTADAVSEVLKEIEAIGTTRPVTPEEIDLARSALTKGYPRNFETAGQVARGLAQLALYDLPDDTFEQFVPAVHRVTSEDITAAARRLDVPGMTAVIVGDRAQVAPGLEKLGRGEPIVLEDE